jgi:hypothetical protein
MTNREELARVLYEAPFGTLALSNWPPSHPDDREWWLTRADAVLAAGWRREAHRVEAEDDFGSASIDRAMRAAAARGEIPANNASRLTKGEA